MMVVRMYNYAGCDLGAMTLPEFKDWINRNVPEDGDKFVIEITKEPEDEPKS